MKAGKKCIFLLGYGRFDQQFESVSFILAREFARSGNKVYYIDYPFTAKDALRAKNSEAYRIREKAFRGDNNGVIETEIPDLKMVVVPPLWSIHFLPEGKLYRKLLSVNEKKIAKTINTIVQADGIEDFIFINSWVFHYPNVSKYIHASLRVYHCIDPIVMQYDVKHGIKSERELIENSDLIVCTSKQLCEERKKVHPKTYFVSNAADINHSIKAADKNLPLHESVARIKTPVIGYFGVIEKRIDYDMLIKVMKTNIDKTFVFAGPVDRPWIPEEFFSLPNVHLTGRIPYEDMPKVLKRFDVAIIPFRKYKDSATVFPMKLFEYLGAGKPVVATDFNPDLASLTGSLVHYCSDAKSFSAAINEALITDSETLRQERIELAQEHTWENRAAAFEKLLSTQHSQADVMC